MYRSEVFSSLLKRDGARCSICGKALTDGDIYIHHIFPRALGGSDDVDNLQLVCGSCIRGASSRVLIGRELEQYIYEVISKSNEFRNVKLDWKAGHVIADLFAERRVGNQWQKVAIEVRYTAASTKERLMHTVQILEEIRERDPEITCVFLTPGKLAQETEELLRKRGIEIWDGKYLAARFKHEIEATYHPIFSSLFRADHAAPPAKEEQIFIRRLRECKPGKENWVKYQRMIGKVLTFLFCPPLQEPLPEAMDHSRANRRDFVFPNYCEQGFWAHLRSRYSADYIVVDAKNSSRSITKQDVLQVSNYLKEHGTGLFGIIVARVGVGDSAYYTLREVWAIEKKMIIILQDNDLEQMLLERLAGRAPETIIRQKIEDFRLSI